MALHQLGMPRVPVPPTRGRAGSLRPPDRSGSGTGERGLPHYMQQAAIQRRGLFAIGRARMDSRTADALLDEYSRYRKALEVLHVESGSELPFDSWVEVQQVAHMSWLEKLKHPLKRELTLRTRYEL